MLEWCKTETEAWTLVHTVTREHRHWRSRHELIDRMAEWAVVYGFQPLEVRVPRFQQEASQKEVDAEIADNDDRLLLISEELERMSEPQPQLVLLRTELRDRDFWHRPTPWLYMPYVCDVHAALWQRLHEWLDEPASENHTASQAAFREALAQAHNLSTTSLGRWRIEVMHRRFHVFGGRNGRGDAGEEVAARNGHGPRGQVPVR
jgi:hypothetical protein